MPENLDLNLSQHSPVVTPETLRKKLPIEKRQKEFIQSTRKTIKNILKGEDPRLLLIVGPCSIHDITAAKEYATKLREAQDQLADQFVLMMRVYLEKPRTSLGWKGLLYDPHIDNSCDMHTGLTLSRELLLDLATLEVPVATEFLDVSTTYYLSDLVSWGCIGARTVSSQFHRQIASGLPMPIGFKNNTDGNISIAIEGIASAKGAHAFIGMNSQGAPTLLQTKGNPFGHLVLRGGQWGPNYDPKSIEYATSLLKKHELTPNLLIDCSHDNSARDHQRQPSVFQSVIKQHLEGNKQIRGALLESHLLEGKQNLSQAEYGVSITDSCLDWETTKHLLFWAYDQCKNSSQEYALR